MGLPNHVAIIMDGNGRWAERRGLPRSAGHQAGFNRIRTAVKTMLAEEVKAILDLLVNNIDREAEELNRQQVQLRHIGRLNELPENVRDAIVRACTLTRNNNRLVFSFAFNYGGRVEILDAAKRLLTSQIPPEKLDEKVWTSNLYTAGLPDVDLLIRTGGELRISNFLLWQSAYAEFYFTRILWPDFTRRHLEKALEVYSRRQRRFGGLLV